MEAYAGFEPQIGEIRAVRTFRIGPGGVLYPLFGAIGWSAGTNTSYCRIAQPTEHELVYRGPHEAPESDCTCGYYAYADVDGVAENPQSRHVLAVIACWGRIIAGTRGIRAQHARIEGIWMSDRVPEQLRAEVAARYRTATICRTAEALLREHPLTMLDCYEPPTTPHPRVSVPMAVVLAAAAAVSSLPAAWLLGSQHARLIEASELVGYLAGATLWVLACSRSGLQAALLPLVAAALWLAAPFADAAGVVLLRLPIVLIALVGLLHRTRLHREAGQFPAKI